MSTAKDCRWVEVLKGPFSVDPALLPEPKAAAMYAVDLGLAAAERVEPNPDVPQNLVVRVVAAADFRIEEALSDYILRVAEVFEGAPGVVVSGGWEAMPVSGRVAADQAASAPDPSPLQKKGSDDA